jgi:hypothetical protein
MRRVEFKYQWRSTVDNSWLSEQRKGLFHAWGTQAVAEGTSYSMAIIECNGGEIVMVNPEWVKFLDNEHLD